ncbi:hypothetical protein KC460_00330 [Candidatus Dependentiae bacterium]|nr:hypothetical protein [Candidatus Dependentiae bacterium]
MRLYVLYTPIRRVTFAFYLLFFPFFISSPIFGKNKSCGYCYSQSNPSYTYNSYYIKKQSLFKKYATSVIPATIIGGVTGGVCALTDKAGLWPFSWFIFSGLRWLIIDALAKDFVDSDVSYNKSILLSTTRIADWAMWLYVMMHI